MRKLATLRIRCNWSDSCPCLIQTQRNRRTVIKQGKNYIFTARCYASAVGLLAMALCPSVRQSVCPSQVGVLLKRINVGSHKQHHTIAQGVRDSSFLTPKISAKFDRGHPLRGRQNNAGGVGQNRRLLTNSRLYLENGTWFLLKSNRKSCALYRMATLPLTLSAP